MTVISYFLKIFLEFSKFYWNFTSEFHLGILSRNFTRILEKEEKHSNSEDIEEFKKVQTGEL